MSILLLKRILGIENGEDTRSSDRGLLFESLSTAFSELNEKDIKKMTGFSGMLGKISYADMDISEEEKGRMLTIFKKALKLDDEKSALLVSILVKHRIQLFSVEDYLYSRLINETCDFEGKIGLLEAMFAVAAADGTISQEEDAAIFAASKSIHLSHKDFISVRRSFAEYLDILKRQ